VPPGLNYYWAVARLTSWTANQKHVMEAEWMECPSGRTRHPVPRVSGRTPLSLSAPLIKLCQRQPENDRGIADCVSVDYFGCEEEGSGLVATDCPLIMVVRRRMALGSPASRLAM
jgi:hypothetical protein